MHIIVYIILPGKNTVKDGPVEKGRHKLVGFPSFFPYFHKNVWCFLWDAALAVLLLLLPACGHPAPEASGAAAEGLSATDTITPEEGVAILEKQLGAVDEATGNVMSYGYEGPLTLDGVDYYNYRVSWLVDGDHLSYLTNYLVSTDGLVVQEYLPETD